MIIDEYKLIAFDLDGILVHTDSKYRYWIVPKVLAELKASKEAPESLIDKFWFGGNRDVTISQHFRIEPASF